MTDVLNDLLATAEPAGFSTLSTADILRYEREEREVD